MMQPTPWQDNGIQLRQADPRERRSVAAPPRPVRGRRAGSPHVVREQWSQLCGAGASIVVFLLLFQPWLTARSYDGDTRADAFGQVTATTQYLNFWSHSSPPLANITGAWAILISLAIAVGLVAAVSNLFAPNRDLVRLSALCATIVAVLVLATLVYLDGKAANLRAMVQVNSHDLGTQLAFVLRAARNRGAYPMPGNSGVYTTATITPWAMLALVISLASAALTANHWVRSVRTARRGRPTPSRRE